MAKHKNGQNSNHSSKDEQVYDLTPFMTPVSILLTGIMISASIIYSFKGEDLGNSILGVADVSKYDCKSSQPLSDECLKSYAAELKLNDNKFVSCLDNGKFADTVKDSKSHGESADIGGTPTLLIGEMKDDNIAQVFYTASSNDLSALEEIFEKIESEGVDKAREATYKAEKQADKEIEDYYGNQQGLTGDELKKAVADYKNQQKERYSLKEIDISKGVTKESGSSKLVIAEFSDYECPYCKSFAEGSEVEIIQEYVDTGEAMFVFFDFPLTEIGHTRAQKAAEAARCAGEQGKYWEMHDKLFEVQE